ncbi:SKP1-like protein 11 [Panicum miliaceum]|uniref:SKP1-like protein 11 n=1 Tax=Panicum miliaceum TaxID=4540 RepID=A0A3L6T8A1_PANMI|nr:SKP1-like protein 11 [Panicum miliaceum]
MAVGKRDTGAAEVEKGESVATAAAKGEKVSTVVAEKGEKGSVVAEKGEKSPTVAEKGKGVAEEEAGKEVADGDMITLKSSDGKAFEVSKEAAARLSTVLAKMMIAGGCSDGCIKLEKIGSETLEKVVDYCNKHANPVPSAASSSSSRFLTAPSKELEDWDRKLVDCLSQDALFSLTEASDSSSWTGSSTSPAARSPT